MTDLTVDHKAIARRLLRMEGLPLEGIDPLARLLRTAHPLQLRAGAVLVNEGEEARDLLFVVRGSIQVHVKDASGQRSDLTILRAPFLLGHIAIIDAGKRSATCEMATDGLVLALPRTRVQALVTSTDRGAEVLRDLMLSGMFRQLDQATERLRVFLRAHPEVHVELADPDHP